MADLETKVEKLEERVTKIDERLTNLEQQVSNTMTKVDMLVDEMRDRDNQRVADIREIRTSISNMQNRIDEIGNHVRNLSLTAMAAIGAMVVTVIISLLRS